MAKHELGNRRARPRIWTALLRGPVFDIAVLAVMFVAMSLRTDQFEWPTPRLWLFALASWAPLLWRRRWPAAALAGAVFVEAVHLAVAPFAAHGLGDAVHIAAYQPVPIATMVAAGYYAAMRPLRTGWIPGAAAALALLSVAVLAGSRELVGTDLLMFDAVLAGTAAGSLLRARQEREHRAEREHQADVERHVLAERVRIARDLHDSLAHHLTLANAQAGVAEYLLKDKPEAAARALRGIVEHTSAALDEARATVGLLRQQTTTHPREEQPQETDHLDEDFALAVPGGVEAIPALVEEHRRMGAIISIETSGSPASLTSSVSLAAYRIVQEALTNAIKHAPGAGITVRLSWSPTSLAVGVENERSAETGPPASTTRTVATSGHGLIGMNERARSVGGQLRTGATATGGYIVEAQLPVNSPDGRHREDTRT